MQYDLDICSDQAELFLHLRSCILSFKAIKEKKNAKQTSYYDSHGVICFLRVRKGKVRLSFANGTRMSSAFAELLGDSKIVRYIEFLTISEVNDKRIEEIIAESLLLNIEKAAIKELRNSTRPT